MIRTNPLLMTRSFDSITLPDDVSIQLGDDLARGEIGEAGDCLLRAWRRHARDETVFRSSATRPVRLTI